MFPITLDVARLNVALVGNGEKTVRRLMLLDEAGAAHVTVYAPRPIATLTKTAGKRLMERFPTAAEIPQFVAVMIVDIGEIEAAQLAEKVRKAGRLVNVEDWKEYCDFYFPAIVRRGDLVLTVSTEGKSPTLARRIREWLEVQFPSIWKEQVEHLGKLRDEWQAEELTAEEIMKRTDAYLDEIGWHKQ